MAEDKYGARIIIEGINDLIDVNQTRVKRIKTHFDKLGRVVRLLFC